MIGCFIAAAAGYTLSSAAVHQVGMVKSREGVVQVLCEVYSARP